MAEKKWSDYWKNYKTSEGKKIDTGKKPGPVFVQRKEPVQARPVQASKIPSSRPARERRAGAPASSRQAILLAAFFIALIALSFLQYRSAQFIKGLKYNVTNLTDALDACSSNNAQLSSSLGTCNANLENCQVDVSNKNSLLSACIMEKDTINGQVSECQGDLTRVRNDKNDLQVNYDSLQELYDSCKDDKSSATSNYDRLLSNLRGYAAKGKCCGTSNSASYSVQSNDIVCYADGNGTYSLTC
ncbi:hypothetical protein A3K63_01595 [Candidatus Micrarchaeota archaeon RBG_16_49_10]|nr:MAG: hypothetical protein A3K63_01595 [Candidatus Micrarchaeota archaeon RBG_16_49_10]